MKELFTISDVFEIHGKGVVVGGINPQLDTLSTEELRRQIGKEVELRNLSGKSIKIPVLGIEVSNSISGHKNLFILLNDELRDYIHNGMIVYS